MKTFEIRIYFGDFPSEAVANNPKYANGYFEEYLRECEDYADARYEAEEIIETQYTKNGHMITGYEVEEITD